MRKLRHKTAEKVRTHEIIANDPVMVPVNKSKKYSNRKIGTMLTTY